MIDEIKAVARRHLATDGANLSLRAVARDMDMVSSALYRYFASRDDLLTALIIDGYAAIGEAAEKADASITERADLTARWMAICRGVRAWALAHPAEYALLYGTPVPGYRAPQDTVAAAVRTPVVLVGILADGYASGTLKPRDDVITDPGVAEDLRRACESVAPGLPEPMLALGMVAWVHLFGVLSFELFGQFNNVIEARDAYFDQHMRLIGELVGL